VVIASAEKSARGTVRVGSRTSPLGTSAISSPTNAKISTIAVRPTAGTLGMAGQRKSSGFTNQMPARTSTSSGRRLARVTDATSRTPTFTPGTLRRPEDVGRWGGGSKSRGGGGGEHEEAGADRHVDDAGGQLARADRAHQHGFGGGRHAARTVPHLKRPVRRAFQARRGELKGSP